jgi:hypothetical protein
MRSEHHCSESYLLTLLYIEAKNIYIKNNLIVLELIKEIGCTGHNDRCSHPSKRKFPMCKARFVRE